MSRIRFALVAFALSGLASGCAGKDPIAQEPSTTTPEVAPDASVEPVVGASGDGPEAPPDANTPTLAAMRNTSGQFDSSITYNNREGRARKITYRVWFPKERTGSLPTILVSHGGDGGSSGYMGFAHLGSEYSASGYLSIHLNHLPSTTPAQHQRDRPDDVKAILDGLQSGRLALPPSRSADMDRIGHAGHSWGAYTSHAVAGAVFEHGTYGDARIRAFAPMSPQGWGGFGAFDVQQDIGKPSSSNSWMGVTIPSYNIVGGDEQDGDTSGFICKGWRLFPFERYPAKGDKYLSVIPGQDHFQIGGAANAAVLEYIARNTRLFFDVYLRGQTASACAIGTLSLYPGTQNRRKAAAGSPGSVCP